MFKVSSVAFYSSLMGYLSIASTTVLEIMQMLIIISNHLFLQILRDH